MEEQTFSLSTKTTQSLEPWIAGTRSDQSCDAVVLRDQAVLLDSYQSSSSAFSSSTGIAISGADEFGKVLRNFPHPSVPLVEITQGRVECDK